jgi:hypothetical protein
MQADMNLTPVLPVERMSTLSIARNKERERERERERGT